MSIILLLPLHLLFKCYRRVCSLLTVLVTEEAAKDPENIGMFFNSLNLSNYEHVYKKEPEVSEDEKDEDPRLNRVTKRINNINVDFEVEKTTEWKDVINF